MKFSEKLQNLRKENKLSQEQLADKLDVSRQSVSKWESVQTYPEMDKLLTLCKLFNITLDDLTNDEVAYKEVKTKNKKTFNSLIDDVVYIIDKTYSMFKNMTTKERNKCISELIILFIVLLLFRLPFEYILSLGNNILYYLPTGNYVLESMWTFLINIVYLILFLFTFIYIYKTYFLDKYKESKIPNDEKKEESNETINEKQKNNTKIIYKETKIKENSIGTTLFEILGKIISIGFKVFLIFVCFPLIISFIALIIVLFILLALVFKGVLYIGLIIGLIAGIITNCILLKLVIAFIFDYKPSFKIIFTCFIISISLLGVGTGLSIIEFANTEYIDKAPDTDLEYITKNYEYNMEENLVINPSYHYYNINYTIDNTLTDTIKIEISYYKKLSYVELSEYNRNDYKIIELWHDNKYSKEIIKSFINNLKNKEIYNYDKLYDCNIKLITSENNLKKLKENKNNYNKTSNYYEIDELNQANNELQNEIDGLNEKIYELTEENQILKDKIQTYKDNLESLID